MAAQERSERELIGYLRRFPNDAEAHYRLGELLLSHNRLATAIRHIKRSLEINPTKADRHLLVAKLFLDEADKLATATSKLSPLQVAQNQAQAQHHFDRAVHLHLPESKLAPVRKRLLLRHNDADHDALLSELQVSNQASSYSNPSIHSALIVTLLNQRNITEALLHAEQCYPLFWNDITWHRTVFEAIKKSLEVEKNENMLLIAGIILDQMTSLLLPLSTQPMEIVEQYDNILQDLMSFVHTGHTTSASLALHKEFYSRMFVHYFRAQLQQANVSSSSSNQLDQQAIETAFLALRMAIEDQPQSDSIHQMDLTASRMANMAPYVVAMLSAFTPAYLDGASVQDPFRAEEKLSGVDHFVAVHSVPSWLMSSSLDEYPARLRGKIEPLRPFWSPKHLDFVNVLDLHSVLHVVRYHIFTPDTLWQVIEKLLPKITDPSPSPLRRNALHLRSSVETFLLLLFLQQYAVALQDGYESVSQCRFHVTCSSHDVTALQRQWWGTLVQQYGDESVRGKLLLGDRTLSTHEMNQFAKEIDGDFDSSTVKAGNGDLWLFAMLAAIYHKMDYEQKAERYARVVQSLKPNAQHNNKLIRLFQLDISLNPEPIIDSLPPVDLSANSVPEPSRELSPVSPDQVLSPTNLNEEGFSGNVSIRAQSLPGSMTQDIRNAPPPFLFSNTPSKPSTTNFSFTPSMTLSNSLSSSQRTNPELDTSLDHSFTKNKQGNRLSRHMLDLAQSSDVDQPSLSLSSSFVQSPPSLFRTTSADTTPVVVNRRLTRHREALAQTDKE